MARFGALHILYNNAGVLWKDRDRSVVDTDERWWDRVMAINLKGVYFTCKYGIPHLIAAGGGSIVLVGSVSALRGFTLPQDAYTASKGALISLTKSLAVQYARNNIRANIIHPGIVETPMQEPYLADPREAAGLRSLDPAGATGPPGGDRQRRPLPGVRRRVLRHRSGDRRRRGLHRHRRVGSLFSGGCAQSARGRAPAPRPGASRPADGGSPARGHRLLPLERDAGAGPGGCAGARPRPRRDAGDARGRGPAPGERKKCTP